MAIQVTIAEIFLAATTPKSSGRLQRIFWMAHMKIDIADKSVYLVRHAESESNAGYPTSDSANIRLTDAGHAQANEFARFTTISPDLIVVSPFLRTLQSAKYFIDLRPHVPVEQWSVQEFVFVTFPAVPPTTPLQRKSVVDAYWHRCDPLEEHPGGESFNHFWSRVTSFFRQVREHPARTIVVFTHGFFIQAFKFGIECRFAACSAQMIAQLHAWSLAVPCGNMSIHEFHFAPGADWPRGASTSRGATS